MPINRRGSRKKGSALLTVLWLSAALSAIGLAVASQVRGETERTETNVDDARAYFAARGAVERAALHILWRNYVDAERQPIYYTPGQPVMTLDYPDATVRVEVIPEASKLSINGIRPEDLLRLLGALGVEPQRALELTQAIVDWRTPADPMHPSAFDAFYGLQTPSFSARHASFQEDEELLLVKGMTPDIYYGAALGATHAGLRDCVSVYGSVAGVDVNTAQPAILETLGISADDAATLVKSRTEHPILNFQDFSRIVQALGPAGARLRMGGGTMYTLRATARLKRSDGKLSDLQRGVEALVKFYGTGNTPLYDIVRWYDRS
jgi:general secretion pathway protein K